MARLEVALGALEDSDDTDVVEATALKKVLKKSRRKMSKQHCPTQVAVSTSASRTPPVQPDDSCRPKQLSQKHNSWWSRQEQLAAGLADLEVLCKEACCFPQTEVSGYS